MPQDKNGLRWRGLRLPQGLVVVAYVVAAGFYFQWRLGSFNPQAPIFSVLLFCAEIYGVLTALLHIFMTARLTERRSPEAPQGLSVDVFIATYNEPVELLRRTALAALELDYPHQVWLLDDGNRPQIAALAAELGCRYLARTDNRDAKAGNLNNALQHSRADYIAIFDADHAPARTFLSETLGYFDDEQVAFVQTPQDFFNLDSYQHRRDRSASVWTEQSLFFRVIQRGKDYWNSAFFCGSCAVIRRLALDRIGGFATGTVTEDLHTSIRIHKAGYKSVYHAHSLAFGIAPSTVAPFLKQRIRWGQGAMQVWRREGILFGRGLTLPQRLNYVASIMTYFDGWQKGFFYAAPIVVLFTGLTPVIGLGTDFLLRFVPYLVLTFWVFEEVGRGYGRTPMIEQYNFARFWAFAWATMALFKRELKFKVTSKTAVVPGYRHFVIPQLTILLLSLLAMPVGMLLCFAYGKLPLDGLVANLLWAGVNTTLAVTTLLFTRRSSSFKRHDYRFPIPLPVWVRIGGAGTAGTHHVFGTVDDISSSGCRIYSPLPADLARNTKVDGKIFLPSGPIAFRGEVASLIKTKPGQANEAAYVKAIGCRFVWDSARDRDRLDLFLYGSDLQWQLLALTERIRTPLESFGDFLHRRQPATQFEPQLWTPVIYHAEGLSEGMNAVALASKDSLLTFSPLPQVQDIEVICISRTRAIRQRRSVNAPQLLQSPLSPLYKYQSAVLQEVTSSSRAQAALNVAAGTKSAASGATLLEGVTQAAVGAG